MARYLTFPLYGVGLGVGVWGCTMTNIKLQRKHVQQVFHIDSGGGGVGVRYNQSDDVKCG